MSDRIAENETFNGVCGPEGLEGIWVEVLKWPTSVDWQWVKFLAMNTVGKDYDMETEMTPQLKCKYLRSEHSPIRFLQFVIRMHIPYCDSVAFCRHKLGVEHFVQSQRNDRQDKYDRYQEPQGHYVKHIMLINAQELMFMARKRLCRMASPNCRRIMEMIKTAVTSRCPEFEEFLVPNCEYLHKCPEFKSCGYWKVQSDLRGLREDPDIEIVEDLDDRGPVETKLLNDLEKEVAADNAKITIEDAKRIADGNCDK